MNREIKFRVWHKDFKKFLPYEEWFLDFNGKLFFNDIIDRISCGIYGCSPDEYVIQQFTGLKDKNYKKIYEGDIIKYIHPDTKEVLYKVEWIDFKYGLKIVFEKDIMYTFFLGFPTGSDFNKAEVIGNIFENPDLLK